MPNTVCSLPQNATLHSTTQWHLPVVRAVIDRLGIYKILNQLLPIDKQRMRVGDADCVILMIFNILHGRVALYKMDEWLANFDAEVLLGEDCPADAFGDARLAAALDRIFEFGPDNVLSEIASAWLQSEHSPSAYSIHSDTSAIVLHGAYEIDAQVINENEELQAPQPAYGHSKDHRPDLKQLVYGLNLQSGANIPLCFSVLDGNTSEQTSNRLHLDRLAGILPPQDEVTFIMDCKLFDKRSLGHVHDADFHFVTLMPRTYNMRKELVEWAVDEHDELPELERHAGRTNARPDRVYRGISTIKPFTIDGPDTGEQEVDLRFLVVESSQLGVAFERGLNEKLAKEQKSIEKNVARLGKQTFACRQDAENAGENLNTPCYHNVKVKVQEETQAVRKGRGRPKKVESPVIRTTYRIVLESIEVDEEKIASARMHAKFFVLATDHIDTNKWSDERILAEYRHQHVIEGHTGFRWLKNVAEIAPMFLKKPERMAALGLVFVLALMVRNYIQWAVRSKLNVRNETLPNANKQATNRPTTEVTFWLFRKIVVILVEVEGHVVQRIVQGIDEHVLHVLDLLDLSPDIFTQPPIRKNMPNNTITSGI